MKSGSKRAKIAGRELELSNLDKVMYPKTGFTKGQVIDYYQHVSPTLLPHLKDRPITMKRYPNGVHGEHFYEKDAPSFTPPWVKTFPIPRTSVDRVINYILVNDLPTLLWSANMANLEMHPFLAKVPRIGVPTMVVFDLDPGDGADILQAAEAAFLVKDLLDRLNLKSFAKASGSKGIHLHVPLNTPVTYEATQPFAKSIAQSLEAEHPGLIVSEMPKVKRKGRVFVDWSQNSEHKSTVAVYSLRAKGDAPFVAMPVRWEELKRAIDRGDAGGLFFEPGAALKRLAKTGDLFAPVLKLKQKLPGPFLQLKGGESAPAAGAGAPSLGPYRRKRDFSKTPEPPPSPRRKTQSGRRLFVIQKHAASHLHYDLRLEMQGVLKSWAVPKGPPYELNERRLAMATEDHPMEYARFEGTIPKGEYGGGTVMVWDIGSYEILDGNYWQGKLHVSISGKKLKGEWVLVKAEPRDGKRNGWYWIKAGEGTARPSQRKENSSALSGRSLEQIAQARDAVWHSNRKSFRDAKAPAGDAVSVLQSLPAARLRFIEPMLAEPVARIPQNGDDWIYEIKLDGYRCLALRDDKRVKLFSRNRNLLNSRFPKLVTALGGIEKGSLIDGEIVALDDSGRPSFNILQNHRSVADRIRFYPFDLLIYRGKSLLDLPLEQRRDLLRAAVRPLPGVVRLSENFHGTPRDIAAAAKELGLEGIVAKRKDSRYEPGIRSGAWAKYRINQGHDLVVGGYTPGPQSFDALLVGYYRAGKLLFVGKVRNGFVPQVRREVFERLKSLPARQCPFSNLPEPKNARRGLALTAEAMKECKWLKPKLVAQIEFAEWTENDHLRHAKFVGLRDDKEPRDVVREHSAEN